MQQFREGSVRVLIATDVSARGIDIPNVDVVVNYDLPDVPENYVHRVGRPGRGLQKGRAISFCSLLESIETFIGKSIDLLTIPKGDYQETLLLHNDRPDKLKAIVDELEKLEALTKPKRKK